MTVKERQPPLCAFTKYFICARDVISSRAFLFLGENFAPFSYRRSGGRRSGFAFGELFCTKIQDRRSLLRWAADLKNCRPSENLLTKISRLAHGSLPAAQQSDPEAFARAEGSSWRKQTFRHEVLAAVLRDDIYAHVAASISWRKSPLFSLRRPEGLRFGIGVWDSSCCSLACSFSHSAYL